MPQRSPLIDLPINRVSGHELSNATRSEIHARACAGESYGAIARSKSLPRSTVSTTVKTVNTRRSVESKARIGRPTVHSDRDRRRILQHVRQHPMCTYDNLKRETGLDFSRSTYRRILRDSGVSHWLAKKRPALTPHQAQVRLAFATLHRHKDWSNTLFSDECSVEKGVGKKRLWAFGDPSQKWDVDKIQTYNKGPGVTVMVWACVGSAVGGSDLIIMERDASAPRGEYSTWSYLEALQEGLLPLYTGQEFQQDGARIHTSIAAQQGFTHWGLNMLQGWPPYSPDLNPIEHLWPRLKENLYVVCPALDSTDSKPRQRALMESHLGAAWAMIPRHVTDVDSMGERLQAVIDAQGWQTRF